MNVEQSESIHDVLERIKILEIKMNLISIWSGNRKDKRPEELVELGMGEFKKKLLVEVEHQIENFLVNHLLQVFNVVKELQMKVDVSLIGWLLIGAWISTCCCQDAGEFGYAFGTSNEIFHTVR